ncbi:MAG TPA: TolC family protein, partial [Myxococcota bacterium]|nr:TolC family protein [Myxococcota bacterium]
ASSLPAENSMRFLPALLAAVAAAALSQAAVAAEAPLTLREAQRLAVERSQSLHGQDLAAGAAREMALAAGRYPDPVLSVGVQNVPIEGGDKFDLSAQAMTMTRVALAQRLTRGDKLELRAERYELEARKVLAERQATLAAIQREVALAWLDAWYAEAMAAVLAEQRLLGLQEVEAGEAEYRAGRGAQAAVLMAHSRLALLDDRAADLERRVATARTMLARWMGEGSGRALSGKPDIATIDLDAHGLQSALATHPQIEALERQREIAATEARLARAERTPDWSVEVAYGERSSRFGDMFSVGVSIPVPWDRANRQDRELAARLALAERAEALREEALRQHVAEVQALVQQWESNRTRLARYEREIIPLAAGRAGAAVAAYRGGKARQGEVLAAHREELQARLQALQLEAETARLWAQLAYLVPEEGK